VFSARITAHRAELVVHPTFTVLQGAPLSPELEECLLRSLKDPPPIFEPKRGWPFPDYDGEVEWLFHIGVGGG
jgi:hypothetical protein